MGFQGSNDGVAGKFDNADNDTNPGEPAKCMYTSCSHPYGVAVEGWVVFVSGIHGEAQEDDIRDAFGDFGKIKNLHLNLDRKSGYVKGYAFIEYRQREEAALAITKKNGSDLLGRRISVAWAFVGRSRMDVSTGVTSKKKSRH
jgi:RNA-binding protein 8A